MHPQQLTEVHSVHILLPKADHLFYMCISLCRFMSVFVSTVHSVQYDFVGEHKLPASLLISPHILYASDPN